MTATRDLRYRLEALAFRGVLLLVSVLPVRLVTGFAHAAGTLVYWVWGMRRRVAVDNLLAADLGLDRREAGRIARQCFQSFVLMLAESFLLRRRITPTSWREHVTFHWTDELRTLLEKPGQPVILASAHIGNWEAAAYAGAMLRPLALVHRPLSNPYLQRLAYGERAGKNVTLLSSLDQAPFRLLEVLSRGEILALMTDQHAGEHRVRVNFFGRPAWTTRTLAMLHLATRAPLVSTFCIRTGRLRYEVHFSGPLQYERTGDRDLDALRITQRLTDDVERIARRFPGQYMWGHRRWKP